jgi:AraC-like DNA-binding protein
MSPSLASFAACVVGLACTVLDGACINGRRRYGLGVVSVLFQAEDQPVAARPEYWQQVVGDTLCPLELRIRSATQVPDRLLVGDVGQVRVAELTASRPGAAARTPAHLRRSDPDMCKIDVQAWGHGVIEHDGRRSSQGPGDFTFIDLSRPARWINAPAQIIAVMFPRALLPLHTDHLARLTGVRIAGHEGVAALLSSLARQLPKHLDDCDGAAGAHLAGAVMDLLTATLAARLDRGEDVGADTRRRALLLRVRAFIDQHLGDPRLNPSSIAAAHYISLRYLHKLFETEQTTVAESIRRRRLEGCRRDLRDPAMSDQPVNAIAARWGLTSAAHFSRAFRAAYGVSPVEYRRLADCGAVTVTRR